MHDTDIEIILHAGAHKTASTHLQNRLLENENLFAKAGCSYLGPERIRDEFGTLWKALGRSNTPLQQKSISYYLIDRRLSVSNMLKRLGVDTATVWHNRAIELDALELLLESNQYGKFSRN